MNNKVKAYSTLIGGICLNFVTGCFFLWANISTYVVSYYSLNDPGISYGFITYVSVIQVTTQAIGY
jgi:hypothetical protein